MYPFIQAVRNALLTIFYFFYFLFKGKPEWKCEPKGEDFTVADCCTEARHNGSSQHSSFCTTANVRPFVPYDQHNLTMFDKICGAVRRGTSFLWQSVKAAFIRVKTWLTSLTPSSLITFVASFIRLLWTIITSIFYLIYSIIFFRRPPSKSFTRKLQEEGNSEEKAFPASFAPVLPAPYFTTTQDRAATNGLIDKGELSHEERDQSKKESVEESKEGRERTGKDAHFNLHATSSKTNCAEKKNVVGKERKKTEELASSPLDGAFYTTREYSTASTANTAGASVPPPPPPPPAPKVPIRIPTSVQPAPSIPPSPITKEVRGGIAVFPPSMMAEIAEAAGNRREIQGDSEVDRSINPTVKERLRSATPTTPVAWSRSETLTPVGWNGERARRARSVGDPRVTRINDSQTNNEAHFIFRARDEDESSGGGSEYRMGNSVYAPIYEAEMIRDTVNKHMDFRSPSRPTTPASSMSRSMYSPPTPYQGYLEGGTNETTLRYRGLQPYSSGDVREVTIVERGRRTPSGVRGSVSSTARNWPPPTNASGADIGKDTYIDGQGFLTSVSRNDEETEQYSWNDDSRWDSVGNGLSYAQSDTQYRGSYPCNATTTTSSRYYTDSNQTYGGYSDGRGELNSNYINYRRYYSHY